MMRYLFFLFLFLVSCPPAFGILDSQSYKIETDEIIPNIPLLKDNYNKKTSTYDRHFSFRWNMPKKFDSEFGQLYQTLSLDERHLSTASEDKIYQILKSMPKEMYPYIGPYLHTLPQLSGRILDMPGIKETKNKFPERIAEKYKDIEDIEYVSPALYLYLMPEMVGEGEFSVEYPQMAEPEYHTIQRYTINPKFLQKIADMTPLSDYIGNPAPKNTDGIRHYIIDDKTSLSGADVKALANTFVDLQEFNLENRADFISTNYLISQWEEDNGGAEGFYFYKQMANPCAAAVRNVRWNNKATEFQKIIGKNGFGLDDWAYICDKTIKAYRRANISLAMMIELRGLRGETLPRFYKANSDMDEEAMNTLNYILGATKEMYNAPKEDVKAVKPNMKLIQKSIPDANPNFLGVPLLLP